MFGYHGKVLRVDLTTQQTAWESLEEEVLRRFIGGTGLGTYLLYAFCPPGIDPFDPANPLIFVGSPLVGTRLTTSSKFAVLTKSPLTGLIGDSLSSSFMATERKKTGCDALLLTGRSPLPCLLAIKDGAVAFLDATLYLGLSTTATEHEIKVNLGRAHAHRRTCQTRPAQYRGTLAWTRCVPIVMSLISLYSVSC